MATLIRADALGITAAPGRFALALPGEVALAGLALHAARRGPLRVALLRAGREVASAGGDGPAGWRFLSLAGRGGTLVIEAATPLTRARGENRPAMRLWGGAEALPDWRDSGLPALAGLPPRALLRLGAGEATAVPLPEGFAPALDTLRGPLPAWHVEGGALVLEAAAACECVVQLRPKSRAKSP